MKTILKSNKLLNTFIIIFFSFFYLFVLANEDFYKLLGVDRSASPKEMKQSYRRLSAKYHPDRNPGDKSAQDMFIKITKAYETLSDPDKKKIYDIYGEEGLEKETQMSHSRKPKGQNNYAEIEVTLEELYNGSTKSFSIKKNVVCKECHGTGGKLGHTHQCPKCKGKGSVIEQMNTGMGFSFQVQNTCNKCGGKGIVFKESCPFCKGRKVVKEEKVLKLDIERGMKDKEEIVFHKEAEQHPDLTPGDMIITLRQKSHHFFRDRKGENLYANIRLNLKDALLGFKKNFKHLDNRNVDIEKEGTTQPFEIKEMREEGMPVHKFPSSKGSLFITHLVKLPDVLTQEEKKILEKMLD